ncbi:phenylalanine--tRNA ligase beta subunit-related protein [Candidatus Similichlamydia epinepheli]|uniref:phenylalanine--tRNA ligase beta subunit-related protein n=1 Tax=Candidatus Similichlamydia epinepheli TaxID=1903953 RepID=UPI000D36F71C|nr:phenylalanine--tRNA ligase beta subunit-related protein [Candidatus Similichlamydia epinepheli]
MEVPFCWLRDWLVWDQDPRDLIPIFESCGLEVEGIEKKNFPLRESVVGRVVGYDEESSALHLSLGDKGFAFAYLPVEDAPPIGSCVPFFFLSQIEKSSISIPSQCNGIVGGWSPTISEKIFPILPLELSEEGKLLSHWCREEYVFSLAFTPDLSFCQNIRGLAFYISSIKGIPFAHTDWANSFFDLQNKGDVVTQVTIEATSAVRNYSWAEVEPTSSSWLPWDLYLRLRLAGESEEAAFLDLLRYVLLDAGHPFLCCDLDKVVDTNFRLVWGGKSSMEIGGRSLSLVAEDLTLKSGDASIFLSGVATADQFRPYNKTKRCFLEMAIFEPEQVAKTSRYHNLLTPEARCLEHVRSSYSFYLSWKRFESLCDTYLLASIVGRKSIQVGDQLPSTRSIPFPINLPQRILGLSWSEKAIEKAIKELGHKVISSSHDQLVCSVSTERTDLHGPEDLLDDLVKKIGLESIPRPAMLRTPLIPSSHDPLYPFMRTIRNRLCGWGFQEILGMDLTSFEKVDQVKNLLGVEKPVRLVNPSSSDREFLRPSLLVSFLEHLERNLSHHDRSFRLFEMGRVYCLINGSFQTEDRLGIFLAGNFIQTPFWEIDGNIKPGDIFDLLGWIEALGYTNQMSISSRPSISSIFQEGQQADLFIGEEKIGVAGKLSHIFGNEPILFAELKLIPCQTNQPDPFVPLPSYPGSSRDVTITLPSEIAYSDLRKILPENEMLEKTTLLSVHKMEDSKCLTVRFFYRSKKKTLSNEEVDEAHRKVVQLLDKELTILKGGMLSL